MLGEVSEAQAEPDAAAPPGLAATGPTEPDVVVIPPPGPHGEQRPDWQYRRNQEPGGLDTISAYSAYEERRQVSRGKAPARRAKGLRRAKAPTRPPKPPPPTAPPTAPDSARPFRRPRRRRVVDGLILLVALASAGSVAYLLTQHAHTAATANGSRTKAPAAGGTETTVRGSAAVWVASQVTRGTKVSCDEAMCQALKADGIPAASLVALRSKDPDLPRSGIMIVTAAVDSMLGSRSVAADAPVTLASFGSGSTQISVRVIAPQGAAAYSSALRSDIAARKASAAGLLQNQRIKVGAEARQQLLAGMVDPRLMLTIAGLASQQPLSVVEFSDLAQGASLGVPFRCADLAVSRPAAQVQSISGFLHGLGSFYPGAHIQVVQFGGRKVVQIEFLAPSPLGLLSPSST
jgi:hypothetical protein